VGVMAATGSGASADAAHDRPSQRSAYFALTVIIFATFLNFFDSTVFAMMAQRIKTDFALTDEQLGFLGGPANIIFYVVVGIPMARLVDIYPRKFVLAGGIAVIGGVTALSGLAQNFVQFICSRMFVGAGGSAHGPGSYSLLADLFPPRLIPRAFALLQLGFIGGTTIGVYAGGQLIATTANWAPGSFMGLRIFGWQWILIGIGLPGFLVSLLFLLIREPARRVPHAQATYPTGQQSFGQRLLTFIGFDALCAIRAKRAVYYPLFAGLALSAVETFGMQFWRTPFLMRTYGWREAEIGAVMGPMLLVASLVGIFLGGFFVEWLARRYKDANVRAATILFAVVTVCAIGAPLMPTAESSLVVMSLGAMFGLAGAVPQNAAVQRVAPNDMRGQVTAFYLFMFTFFGAMGSFVIGSVAQRIVGNEAELWKALVITASILLPLATFFMWRGIKPYGEEVARLEASELAAARLTNPL
jgi:MFS family permease